MRQAQLALPAALLALVSNADAQCGSHFEPFYQSIAPVYVPGGFALSLVDLDGAGPLGEQVVYAGDFFDLQQVFIADIAVHDAATDTFTQLGANLSEGGATEIAFSPSGGFAVIEQYTNGIPTNQFVEEWNGQGWTTLGSVTTGVFGGDALTDLLYLPNGDLVVCGDFSSMGGVAVNNVARWDGASWSDLGSGLTGVPLKLQLDPQGDLLVGTAKTFTGPPSEGVARLDGGTWSPHLRGTLVVARQVAELAFLSDGRVAGVGEFEDVGSGDVSVVAIWDGQDWAIPGDAATSLLMPNPARAIVELPGGGLLVGGAYVLDDNFLGIESWGIVEWDGSEWTTDHGFGFPGSTNLELFQVEDMLLDPRGDVWVAGKFGSGMYTDGGLARLSANCQPSATPYGASGSGSAGAIQLSTASLPWPGTTLSAQVDGLAAGALAYSLLGFQQDATPLSALTPDASADSTLLLLPDLNFFAPLAGASSSASWELPLPNVAGLAGLSIYLQALSIELLPGGGLLIASSNGLELIPAAF